MFRVKDGKSQGSHSGFWIRPQQKMNCDAFTEIKHKEERTGLTEC
jgi:hypothetical protein